MTDFRAGEIVLARFPYTSLTQSKERPCLILAQCALPDDYIVAYISSSEHVAQLFSAIRIPINTASETGLVRDSYLRIDKIYTLHRSLIAGKIGALPKQISHEAKSALRKLLGI